MTGEKDKFKTQEKLWKIDDETLKTPAHDELVLKLMDRNYLQDLFFKFEPYKSSNLNITFKSEVPILNNRFIIGYWDLVVDFNCQKYNPPIKPTEIEEKYYINCDQCSSLKWFRLFQGKDFQQKPKRIYERRIYSKYEEKWKWEEGYHNLDKCPLPNGLYSKCKVFKFLDPHRDSLLCYNEREKITIQKQLCIEAKPKINSFGATLRQLKTYIQYYHQSPPRFSDPYLVILFTPDLRFKEAFESQGIIVVSSETI